jgi:predicted dehydrogenase
MGRPKLRVGIIGLGIISDAHVQGAADMSEIAEIVAVCDVDKPKAAAVATRFGARVYTDYRHLLDQPDIDMVDIILPHHLHYDVVRCAIEHGKHVLVEKPLTIHSHEGLHLVQLAHDARIKFSVAENTRFVKAYLAAEALLRAGDLGDIYLIRTLISGSEIERLRNPHPWKAKKDGSGGGVIMDAGPHSFYLLKWLFGDVASVRAFVSRKVSTSEVEDNGLVVGYLTTGAEFNAQFSFTALSPWSERLEIYGTKAALIVDQIANPVATLYHGTEDFFGTPLPDVPYDPVRWKLNSIVDEVKDFIRVVHENGIPKVDPIDAYRGLRVVEAAYESVVRGEPLTVEYA